MNLRVVIASLSALLIVTSGVYAQGALEYWKQAQQLAKEGNHVKALELYSQGLSLDPLNQSADRAYNNRGLLYYASGDCRKAL